MGGYVWRRSVTSLSRQRHRHSPPKSLAFSPGLQDSRFWELKLVERSQACHFIANGWWMTRRQIVDDLALAGLSFWQKVQLAHFIGSLPPPKPFQRHLTTFELLCLKQAPIQHAVSQAYQLLIAPPQDFKLPYITRWEQELGLQFTEKQVDRILLFSYKTSICAKYQEAGFKVLTRWYHTPVKIHRMFPQCSDLCWRCGEDSGSLLHIFWSCCLLQSYLTEIHRIIQKFTDRELPRDPVFFLLHHHEIQSKVYRRSILPLLLTAAKSCIPLFWKQTQPPPVAVWLKKVAKINAMENLVATAKGLSGKCLKNCFIGTSLSIQRSTQIWWLKSPSVWDYNAGSTGLEGVFGWWTLAHTPSLFLPPHLFLFCCKAPWVFSVLSLFLLNGVYHAKCHAGYRDFLDPDAQSLNLI